jgi:tRNA(Ile)-lysidine synthetase-like protein
MYHVFVHFLVQRMLVHIRRQDLLRAGDRVGVAVSGGIDSVALLRLLRELRGELGIVLSVVHFNHKLRGTESEADQKFVACLAREHDLEFLVDSDDVAQHAAEEHVSVEAAARELRYGFFRQLLGEERGGTCPSGDEVHSQNESADRNAESAAPGKDTPQRLKPDSKRTPLRAPEGPLSHGAADDVSGTPVLSKLDKIVTGHTLDDQAETVLMRMIRGAGLRGLGGIHSRIFVEDGDRETCSEIVRPLLGIRRRELEQYLKHIGQTWREDSTNLDTSLTRNRVRQFVMPLLEKEFNPAAAENLAELAEIARGEEDYWENEVAGWMGTAVHWSQPDWARAMTSNDRLVQIAVSGGATARSRAKNDLRSRIESARGLVMNATVDLAWFLSEPVAVQRRLVTAIGGAAGIPLEFKHVDGIVRFAHDQGAGKRLSLPLGWAVARDHGELLFLTPDLRGGAPQQDYEYELLTPGQTIAPEAGVTFEARRIPAGALAGYDRDHLLDAESLPGALKVRNWRPGDRFWPAHTKSPKKIKELLQERHVAQPERKLWPVVVSGADVVWVRGFPAPDKFRVKPGRDALLIAEKPLGVR